MILAPCLACIGVLPYKKLRKQTQQNKLLLSAAYPPSIYRLNECKQKRCGSGRLLAWDSGVCAVAG